MVIPLMIGGLLLFSVVFFGIYQYQRHQMKWTRNILDEREAFFLADAALHRGVARFVARPYVERWYGATPVDDMLTGRKHSGLLDQTSQGADDGAGPLVAGGTYTLLAEDRYDGEREGLSLIPSTNLDYTELFAHATVQGAAGPVSALVYGRLAICPETCYLNPDPTDAERIKKMIRYRVYTAPDLADKPYTVPGTDTAAARSRFEYEIAKGHENYLRNRVTFKDLRTKVDATWNKPAPGTCATYSDAQVDAMFANVTPPAQNPNVSTDPAAYNWWLAGMIRNYRLADPVVAAPEGERWLLDPQWVYDARREQIEASVMLLFTGKTLQPMPDWIALTSPNPTTTGDKFMDRVIKNNQAAEDMISEPMEQWTSDVANFWRDEDKANIVPGHIFPYPTPTGPFTDPKLGQDYADSAFLDAFAAPPPPAIADMKAEVVRINTLLPAKDQLDPNEMVRDLGIQKVSYPVLLYSQLTDPAGALQNNPLSVADLLTYCGKYVEAPQAPFLADGGGDPGPAYPPDDPAPPKETPDLIPVNPPAPPTGNGGYVTYTVVP